MAPRDSPDAYFDPLRPPDPLGPLNILFYPFGLLMSPVLPWKSSLTKLLMTTSESCQIEFSMSGSVVRLAMFLLLWELANFVSKSKKPQELTGGQAVQSSRHIWDIHLPQNHHHAFFFFVNQTNAKVGFKFWHGHDRVAQLEIIKRKNINILTFSFSQVAAKFSTFKFGQKIIWG